MGTVGDIDKNRTAQSQRCVKISLQQSAKRYVVSYLSTKLRFATDMKWQNTNRCVIFYIIIHYIKVLGH